MADRTHKNFPSSINLPEKVDFIGMSFDKDGYKIRVSEFSTENGGIFELDFGVCPLAQRSMDEGNFLQTSWEVDLCNGPLGPVVIVEGADFAEWFQAESAGVHDDNEIYHIAVLTQNEWVEVLCKELPTVRKIA